MDIRCEGCGCPNQFGTVFCRNCGKKLKVQDLSTMSKNAGSGKKVFKRIVQTLITLVVLAALCGLFLPMGLKDVEVYDGTEKNLENLIRGVQRSVIYGQTRTFSFTPGELVAVIDTIGQREREAYRKRPNKKNSDPEIDEPEGVLGLAVNDDNTLTAIYEMDFAAAIPFRMTLTGEPVIKKGTVTIKAISATWGHIPMPDGLFADMEAQFGEYLKERISENYLNAVEEVTIKEGKIRVRFKKDDSKGGAFGNDGVGFSGGKNFGSNFGGNSNFGGGELKSGSGDFGK